eukprot:12938737-Alexandrium_andersonii.AAC.1
MEWLTSHLQQHPEKMLAVKAFVMSGCTFETEQDKFPQGVRTPRGCQSNLIRPLLYPCLSRPHPLHIEPQLPPSYPRIG